MLSATHSHSHSHSQKLSNKRSLPQPLPQQPNSTHREESTSSSTGKRSKVKSEVPSPSPSLSSVSSFNSSPSFPSLSISTSSSSSSSSAPSPSSPTSSSLSTHLETLLPLSCPFSPICTQRFANEILFHSHCLTDHNVAFCLHSSCKMNHVGFHSEEELRKHHEETHYPMDPNLKYQCLHCGKRYLDQESYEDLSSLLNPSPSSPPSSCYFHHSNGKPYVCSHPSCGYSFSRRSYLLQHGRIHSGEKRFQCDICHSSFGQSSTLKRHQRIHKNEKPFKCQFCHKEFRHSNTKKDHERTQHKEKEQGNNNNQDLEKESEKGKEKVKEKDGKSSKEGKTHKAKSEKSKGFVSYSDKKSPLPVSANNNISIVTQRREEVKLIPSGLSLPSPRQANVISPSHSQSNYYENHQQLHQPQQRSHYADDDRISGDDSDDRNGMSENGDEEMGNFQCPPSAMMMMNQGSFHQQQQQNSQPLYHNNNNMNISSSSLPLPVGSFPSSIPSSSSPSNPTDMFPSLSLLESTLMTVKQMKANLQLMMEMQKMKQQQQQFAAATTGNGNGHIQPQQPFMSNHNAVPAAVPSHSKNGSSFQPSHHHRNHSQNSSFFAPPQSSSFSMPMHSASSSAVSLATGNFYPNQRSSVQSNGSFGVFGHKDSVNNLNLMSGNGERSSAVSYNYPNNHSNNYENFQPIGNFSNRNSANIMMESVPFTPFVENVHVSAKELGSFHHHQHQNQHSHNYRQNSIHTVDNNYYGATVTEASPSPSSSSSAWEHSTSSSLSSSSSFHENDNSPSSPFVDSPSPSSPYNDEIPLTAHSSSFSPSFDTPFSTSDLSMESAVHDGMMCGQYHSSTMAMVTEDHEATVPKIGRIDYDMGMRRGSFMDI